MFLHIITLYLSAVPPLPPNNVEVSEVTKSSITLTWKAPDNFTADGETYFLVEYTKDGKTWTSTRKTTVS